MCRRRQFIANVLLLDLRHKCRNLPEGILSKLTTPTHQFESIGTLQVTFRNNEPHASIHALLTKDSSNSRTPLVADIPGA